VTAAGVVVTAYAAVAVAAPALVPARALSVVDATGPALAPPGPGHPLGTDENGLSVLALTLAGSRTSLAVGVLAAALAVGLGCAGGVVAGTLGGWADRTVLGVTDLFVALPVVPVAVVLAGVLAPGTAALVLAIAVTSWAGVARVVRAAVQSAQAQPYVERVRALGARRGHVVREHVLPAVLPLVGARACLTLADAILLESTLSFLGLGRPGQVSWGAMLRHAAAAGAVSAGAWWYLLAPGLAVVVLALAGAAVARALDPEPRA
jgi:peptide/nickel transport system permease protein